MSYVGNTPADKFLTLEKQQFSVSATTGYTLSHSVSSPQDIALFINNVRQNPNSSYTVSGTALTLSSATSSGDTMYCVFLGKAIGTVAPATGSVTNDMLSGSIANAKLTNSSITLNGSAVSLGGSATIASGITVARTYRLTTSLAINAATVTTIASNWESVDTNGGGSIGTAMSESSGIFSYPSTGIYLVNFVIQNQSPSQGATYAGGIIQTTPDNSTYGKAVENYSSIYHSNGYGSSSLHFIHDVTNTTNDKIRFQASCEFASDVLGNTNDSITYVSFIRLGDT